MISFVTHKFFDTLKNRVKGENSGYTLAISLKVCWSSKQGYKYQEDGNTVLYAEFQTDVVHRFRNSPT